MAGPAEGFEGFRVLNGEESIHFILNIQDELRFQVAYLSASLCAEQQRNKDMKRKHSNLDALFITHRNNELKLLQAKVELRDSPRLESEKTRKVECERQKLDIKLQEMEGEHRAVMTEIESQLREKEEKESALIKEGEDDIWKIKREHEGKEGKLQTAMTDIVSQLHEKEGYEGVSIKEKDKVNCGIKHEHEER